MTPYGYRIQNAEALVIETERQKLITFFQMFISGTSLTRCVKESGIERKAPTCKAMLSNRVYLGTDYYPPIIPASLFMGAQIELKRRKDRRKPVQKERYLPSVPVQTRFMIAADTGQAGPDPLQDAVRLYERIIPDPEELLL